MPNKKSKLFKFRNFLKGASTLLLGGLATSVPAATLTNLQDSEWNTPEQSQDTSSCGPELLALADLGALPGTYEGCISDRGISLEDLMDRLPTQPQLPGVPPTLPNNEFYRAIHHNSDHYTGGGSDENNGFGNGDQDAPGGSGDNNNAENSDSSDPTDGSNSGGGSSGGGSSGGDSSGGGGPQGNNGFGNGDQDAPGGSADTNNAENSDSTDPSSDTSGNNNNNNNSGG